MKKTNPDRKPTMKEVKNVINNLILMVDDNRKKLFELDQIVGKYIDFKKDNTDFKAFIEKEIANESNIRKDSGEGLQGNREAEVRSIKASGKEKSKGKKQLKDTKKV